MKSTLPEERWKEYVATQLSAISALLKPIGYELSEHQPHLSGERYLMTRNKLVLAATRMKDGMKVIVKTSNHPDGQKEIITEKTARDTLMSIEFASEYILFPVEIYHGTKGGYMIWITEYIPQDKVFVAHTIEDQFFLILRAFEAQESFHATTLEHLKTIQKNFVIFGPDKYLESFKTFPEKTRTAFAKIKSDPRFLVDALKMLQSNVAVLGRYSNYLTHTDFVPHNFRVRDHAIYMLDCSAVHFGNKYEGWARFLNYMFIHNPKLEAMLLAYIRKNRGAEEYLDLRLMRAYKIGYLLNYYAAALEKTDGDLRELTKLRLSFWHDMLMAILNDIQPDPKILPEYLAGRNRLRSPEEKERQQEFAAA
ncbi:MAG: hypothetical protein A3I98_03040 [Candidatus Taylorbacteria bacterium RIFCSPLOWO2_02_FULL_45_10b]|nr:MAG: hypothetical protein A3I98_03040 [Candidatus Taylorbacteria bacterium RIFCSPLOWO2_02_FULL_45_10b]OHA43504.1 MAG: hypothetical protein A3G04_03610 [Candidatus Taylorbacteria bacterium RIFCSPLOWO2_12_FULL_44_9]